MDALGIERKDVEKIIREGMKWKESHTKKWHASMAGIECVFTRKEDAIFVITVYENGGKK